MNRYQIDVPEGARRILHQLEQAGYEAYIVGGCVRDSLLGLKPEDWDVTTNATPQQVMEVFQNFRVLPTGIKHGTITVFLEDDPYEITTYRIEGDYNDHRHPDHVDFTTSLKEDLSRRDFTMNALAYHPDKGIQDYHGGIEDLNRRLIRCVGDPQERFQEDALRLLRCVRFSSQLEFQIEDRTKEAMLEQLDLLEYVAPERIQVELNKALLGSGFYRVFTVYHPVLTTIIPELNPMIDFHQQTKYHLYDVYDHTLRSVAAASDDLIVRLTLLLHDVGKPTTFAIDGEGVGHFPEHAQKGRDLSRQILQRLRYSREVSEKVLLLIRWHDYSIPPTTQQVRHWLNFLGEENFPLLLEVQRGDAEAKNPEFGKIQLQELSELEEMLHTVLEQKLCFSLDQLELSGRDLLELGIQEGPLIGEILNRLLQEVIHDRLENQRSVLIDYVKRLLP